MNKRIVLLLLGAAIVVVAAVFVLRSTKSRPAPPPASFTLANGLQVTVISRDCGEKAGFALEFPFGSNADPAGRSGMVHVVEQLLTNGEDILTTSNDSIVYASGAPKEKVFEALATVANRFAQPSLTEAAFAAAKTEVLKDIKDRSGVDAQLTAITDASEAVLPSPGHGRRGGVAAEVEGIDLAQVEAFWKAHLTAGNARLVLVGDLDLEKAKGRVEEAFGKWAKGTPPALRPAGDVTVTGTLVFGDAPTAVAIALKAPAMSDPAFVPFLVEVAKLIRASAVSREWMVSYDPWQPDLLLVVGAVKATEQPEPAAGRIRAEVMKVVEQKPTEEEINAGWGLLENFFVPSDWDAACRQNPRAFAVAYARLASRDRKAVPERTAAIRYEEGAKFFAPDRVAAVIAGGEKR